MTTLFDVDAVSIYLYLILLKYGGTKNIKGYFT